MFNESAKYMIRQILQNLRLNNLDDQILINMYECANEKNRDKMLENLFHASQSPDIAVIGLLKNNIRRAK